jgi:hypothetical protein
MVGRKIPEESDYCSRENCECGSIVNWINNNYMKLYTFANLKFGT